MNNTKRKGIPVFLQNIVLSLVQLWNTRDELRLKNIRMSNIYCFLALPLLLSLVNMQNNYCRVQSTLFELDSLSMMYISYCIGILGVILNKLENWFNVARCFALLAVISIILRLFMPDAKAELVCLILCWMGLGGCGAYAIYLYVFLLNNTERLFGVLLVAFSHGILMCLVGLGISGIFLTSILPVLLTISVMFCIFNIKPVDVPDTREQKKPLHPSIWLSTAFFTLLFILDSASSFVFTHQSLVAQYINGIGVIAAILLSVIIQIVYKHSVWHMWNLFFILSFLCHLIPTVSDSEVMRDIASFLHGMLYVGYIAIVYTISGIYKKHGSVALLKKNLFIMFGILALALTGLGFLESTVPQLVSAFITTGSAALFFVFVLLAPLFQRYFFGAEWSDDFHKIDMSLLEESDKIISDADRINEYGLTPREKEVCALLLQGQTLRQISAVLHISFSTVNTHYKNLYRKLNINSRTELMVMFRDKISMPVHDEKKE